MTKTRTKTHDKAIACTFEAASVDMHANALSNHETGTSVLSEPSKPSVGFDADYYQSFLDDYDIPEDQKRELIEALWAIIVQLIDLGFGVHPINAVQGDQQAGDTLKALQAVTREFAADIFDADHTIDPVLIEELVIADPMGERPTPDHKTTSLNTQTERSET